MRILHRKAKEKRENFEKNSISIDIASEMMPICVFFSISSIVHVLSRSPTIMSSPSVVVDSARSTQKYPTIQQECSVLPIGIAHGKTSNVCAMAVCCEQKCRVHMCEHTNGVYSTQLYATLRYTQTTQPYGVYGVSYLSSFTSSFSAGSVYFRFVFLNWNLHTEC